MERIFIILYYSKERNMYLFIKHNMQMLVIYTKVNTHLCETRNLSRNNELLPTGSSKHIEALSGSENLLQTDSLLSWISIISAIISCTPIKGW